MLMVGIMGASGYMGGEALRVLLDHPKVQVAWATTRHRGAIIEDFHPNLYGTGVTLIHPDDTTPCDVVFLALPIKESIPVAARFLEQGCKVIDLGAAFRLSDRRIWEHVYGQVHSDWSLAQEAVFGMPELHKESIQAARLVANPGCFSSAAILGLAPLLRKHLIDEQKIIINGLSGTAGGGAELARVAHHAEIGNNLIPYNVVGHRHTFEMEQELGILAEKEVTIHFTPTYVPIVRGILDICHVFPIQSISREDVLELYRAFYQNEPFVLVYDLPKEQDVAWQYKPYPWVSAVAGTNYCLIGVDVDEVRQRIVIFSVLDSVGKGGAQVGIENMNMMFGFNRTTGLLRRGLHP